jgi:hypothetical protein
VLGVPRGLNTNPNKPGQHFRFDGGLLVTLDNNPNPTPPIGQAVPRPAYLQNTASVPPFLNPQITQNLPHSYPDRALSSPEISGPPPYELAAFGNAHHAVPAASQLPPGAASPTPSRTAGSPDQYFSSTPTTATIPWELIPPFAVYDTIFEYFRRQGGLDGRFGRPLCDEQDLGDGGRCSIFEGGHIHLYNGQARE